MTILALPRFLKNSRGVCDDPVDSRLRRLTVDFGPDRAAQPRKRDFPIGCPVQGQVHSEIAAPLAGEGWMWEMDAYGTDIVDTDMRNEMTAKDGVAVITETDDLWGDRLDRLEKTWNRLAGGAACKRGKPGGEL